MIQLNQIVFIKLADQSARRIGGRATTYDIQVGPRSPCVPLTASAAHSDRKGPFRLCFSSSNRVHFCIFCAVKMALDAANALDPIRFGQDNHIHDFVMHPHRPLVCGALVDGSVQLYEVLLPIRILILVIVFFIISILVFKDARFSDVVSFVLISLMLSGLNTRVKVTNSSCAANTTKIRLGLYVFRPLAQVYSSPFVFLV